MPLVTIVNPSPRKGSKMATRKKARTAKQKAATRKMIAANRARARGASAPRRRARSAAAPKRRRAARRTTHAAAPARKRRVSRRRGGWKITSPRAASRAGRQLRYRRPNPIDFLSNTLMPSVVGGAGALALDVAFGIIPLPATLKTGPLAPLVKVAGAVGLGMLASKMVNRRFGEQVAAGGLTVQIYNFAKGMLVKVGGGKIPGLSMYPDGYMGEYVSGEEIPALGYTDSGMQVGEYVEEGMAGYESGVYR